MKSHQSNRHLIDYQTILKSTNCQLKIKFAKIRDVHQQETKITFSRQNKEPLGNEVKLLDATFNSVK